MTVYLDAIWFLNFTFDFLLLKITAIVLKRQTATWRLILGAFIGSLIVVLMFTSLQAIVTHTLVKLAFSIAMILISFGFKRFRYTFENLLVFYITTFAAGGGMIGVHYFFQVDQTFAKEAILTLTEGMGDPVSWLFVIIGFPIVLYLSRSQSTLVESRKYKYDQLASVYLKIEDEEIELRGLIDSGNQLQDPITKSPVMILQVSEDTQFVPKEIFQAMEALDQIGNWPTFPEEGKWLNRIRMIPFRAVGKDSTIMIAIKPDKATIHHDGLTYEVHKFLVGLTKTPLSSEGDYNCILHPTMLNGTESKNVS